MVWHSHLLKNFPKFVVIQTVKGFCIVNKAEVDVFLELSCFFHDPTDVGNLISGSSAFSKSSLNIWKFSVHVLLKPRLENFEHYFTSMWGECNCAVVWALFGIAFIREKEMATHSTVLAWRIPGTREPGGLPSMGLHRVGHDWSNLAAAAAAAHASKVMLKILQARLQQYVNRELPDVKSGLRKGRGTRDQIANICWIMEKAREFQKNIYFS